jgi:phage gp46-like protein
MTDIATTWRVADGIGDWSLDPTHSSFWTDESGNSIVDHNGQPIDAIFVPGEGLVSGSDLITAILISLFTDAAADPGDIIPDGSGNPRGWWGGAIGSKLWLRERSKQTATTLALVKNDIEQALDWMVADGVIAGIEVMTEWTRPGMLGAEVILKRTDGARTALKFSKLWESS